MYKPRFNGWLRCFCLFRCETVQGTCFERSGVASVTPNSVSGKRVCTADSVAKRGSILAITRIKVVWFSLWSCGGKPRIGVGGEELYDQAVFLTPEVFEPKKSSSFSYTFMHYKRVHPPLVLAVAGSSLKNLERVNKSHLLHYASFTELKVSANQQYNYVRHDIESTSYHIASGMYRIVSPYIMIYHDIWLLKWQRVVVSIRFCKLPIRKPAQERNGKVESPHIFFN